MAIVVAGRSAEQQAVQDSGEPEGAPLEEFPDPAEMTPLGDEAEFASMLEGMVADEAPRLFAIVQEYGERVDARIAAWGMAFGDHADVVASAMRGRFRRPQNALPLFNYGSRVRARLVWFNPDAATPVDDEAGL